MKKGLKKNDKKIGMVRGMLVHCVIEIMSYLTSMQNVTAISIYVECSEYKNKDYRTIYTKVLDSLFLISHNTDTKKLGLGHIMLTYITSRHR